MGGIVFGCIVPHPPLLVPEVGEGRKAEIASTTKAMQKLTTRLSSHKPEAVFVISPHGELHYEAMGVVKAMSLSGSMRRWGTRGADHEFENDPQMVDILIEEAKAANVPIRHIGGAGYDLDHGVMVPMSFLVEGVKGVPMVPLTFSGLPLRAHFEFGKVLRRTAERSKRRVAIVASGDLSHRLIPGAPAGYDPQGKVFDEKLIEALAHNDARAVLQFDPDLIERAGECGLRSIVILLGALERLNTKPEMLSYEGPFGVGYLVASFEVEIPE